MAAKQNRVDVSYVRLALRDKTAEDNYLLDDVVFTDDEINYAIQATVDAWNETPPCVTRDLTADSFPWNAALIDGIKGKLFSIASYNMVANNLAYSAGGVSVDDKNKFSPYAQLSKKYWDQYMSWMIRKKKEINITSSFVSLRR
jgi:hypothetical protein